LSEAEIPTEDKQKSGVSDYLYQIMMKIFKRNYFAFLIFLFSGFQLSAQQVPFSVEIEPVIAGPLPAMHSFAFAQSGSKWLFIGGRTNGIHGFSTNNNFDVVYASDVITVIDTATWSWYSSPLGVLPTAEADPLRSTNMEYTRIGDYLYLAGGFGWDSTANGYRTFPNLTAIHVDNMINAVISGSVIAPNIRQITDTNFRVCGGEMQYANGECFLFFGHNFRNRYSDPPQPTFTQTYSNRVKKFTINDDGTNLSVSNFTYETDTNNYHRRDFNLGNVILNDGSQAWCIYSGVFQKTHNLPYTAPINYNPLTGAQVDSSFSQQMNNYTCGLEPLYDSVQKTMYTILFGGESEYDYNPANGTLTLDTLIPFVSDVSVLVHWQNGAWTQVPLTLQMPGMQGSNMKFIPLNSVPQYSNEVVKLRELSGRVLAGYLVGGIVSANPNYHTSTWANDTVYRVWITPDQNLLSMNEHSSENKVDVFPNPSNDHVTVRAHYSGDVSVGIYDSQGQLLRYENHSGRKDVTFSTQNLAAGIYTVRVTSGNSVTQKKLVIVR
jgi:hypothetical protein